ncbi:MAG: hypothetical protein FD155_35 [Bacteroidetes bacterium]|nr:MAG: hypothetical protein FD155_35 [Bacteroidota bacterium]
MENEEFKKQIDELFRLFNKLMEKHPMDEMPGINKMQIEQMRLFLKNYEFMKDQITYEMMGQMNEPVKQMIGMFIKQLRDELGENDWETTEEVKLPEKSVSIAAIDEKLRKPGLTEVEIDRLLDERAQLVLLQQTTGQ